jgi:hypothetical protein
MSTHYNFDYYKIFDNTLEKATGDEKLKNLLKQNFCHQCYYNRLQYNNEKFMFYCKFFDLDSEYLKNNIIEKK